MPSFTDNKRYMPAHVLAKHAAKHLLPRNKMALRMVASNMMTAMKKPSQRKVAMSMLPKNFANRLTIVGMVPRHVPNGKYTRGHRTIQNLLKMYRTPLEKRRQLNAIMKRMRNNKAKLPNMVKARLNKMMKN